MGRGGAKSSCIHELRHIDNSMDAAAIVNDVELAVIVLGERGNTEGCIKELLANGALLTGCRYSPDPALDKISVDIKALQLRNGDATVDVTAGDGLPLAVVVLGDGIN